MVLVSSVGVIGLDPVGGTVARRLLDQGLEVTAHDPDRGTVATMALTGATPARIPADAAELADVVFVHVPDETALEEVLFDLGGVGETLRDGGFVVSASATDATFILSAAERLAVLGLRTVEAWFTGLSGGIPDTVLVGCTPGELEALTPVLRMVATNVAHIGPLGSVSELRSAVTALTRVRPLLSEDGSSAAAGELLRVLTGPVGNVSRGSAPNGRSDRSAMQPTPPPARVPVDSSIDGRPAPDARQRVERDRAGAGAPRPRAPR
ncbi:NAD(P)-binding domain-containing protein [Geodermatophilus poikilotrophus]|uniref:NAD(P)-binding domain-containing protein n=1 Tax=Geodermatophilus poikilotrophus TaxID=1333667 RepID=UPI000B80CDE6|nr:NAD(P)-binding domain-containing protein [Geodermatophilus poikilotrophus]